MAFFHRLTSRTIESDETKQMMVEKQSSLQTARMTALVAAGLLGVSLLALLLYLVLGRWARLSESTSLALLASMVTLVAAGIVLAVANLRSPNLPWQAIVGLAQPDFDAEVHVELAGTMPQAPPMVRPPPRSRRMMSRGHRHFCRGARRPGWVMRSFRS